MKKLFFTTAMFILFASVSIAQTRTLNLGEFTSIDIRQAFNVQLMQSNRCEIIVPANFSDDIFTINDGVLKIWSTNPRTTEQNATTEQITILFTTLERLVTSGASRVSSEHEITGESIKLELSGASVTTLTLVYDDVSTNVSGAARLTLSGRARQHNLQGSGAAWIRTREFETQETNINLSGASQASLNTRNATGTVTGTSRLIFANADAQHDLVTVSGTATINNQAVQRAEQRQRQRQRDARRFSPAYSGFDFGINSFGQDFFRHSLPTEYKDMELSLHNSFVMNLNISEFGLRLGRSNFGVGAGLGVGWNIYRFLEHDMIPGKDKSPNRFVINQSTDTTRNFGKSNLRSSWLRIPAFVQYQNKDFSVTAGVVGNVRLGASAKQVFRFEGNNKKQRDVRRDNFYLNGLRLDTELRAAYKQIGVFAAYSLTDMFLNNRGPELNAFSFGLTLMFN